MSGLSGSLSAESFTFITPSALPEVVTGRNMFQYTLLTRGNDIRRQPGIQIHDVLQNAPNSCSFRVDGGSPAPQVGEKIEIRDFADDNRLLFAGIVQSVEMVYEGLTFQLAWNVQCIDFTWLLNRRRPFGSFINVSASLVVTQLIQRYAPGFTTNHVQTNLAKVTVILDGTKDMVTVLSDIANAIGGGHWFADYDMDMHFFHIVPKTLQLPPSAMPASNTTYMTVAMGASVGYQYSRGYYMFRHSFVYSDGTESSLQLCSNFVQSDGHSLFVFTGVPLGTPKGTLTCVGRRIYFNKFTPGAGTAIEDIQPWCYLNDNVTTAFSCYYGSADATPVPGASSAVVVPFTQVTTITVAGVATPTGMTQLSDQAAAILLSGQVARGDYGVPDSGLVQVPIAGIYIEPGVFCAGFATGDPWKIAFTAVNSSGETTLGAIISGSFLASAYTGGAIGPEIKTPPLPVHATSLNAYVSIDGGVTYHKVGSTLSGQQLFRMNKSSTTIPTLPTQPLINAATIEAIQGWIGAKGAAFLPEGTTPTPGASGTGNVVYFATTDIATALENAVVNNQRRRPYRIFNGHPAGPSLAPSAGATLVTGTSPSGGIYFNGSLAQFKVAFVFRDGSVSYPSPASNTAGLRNLIRGTGITGYHLSNVPVGDTVSGHDVIARFIYSSYGSMTSSNTTLTRALAIGEIWPVPFNDPSWSPSSVSPLIAILPDNTSITASDAVIAFGVGRGNKPYDNGPEQAVINPDPIPIWPNPDGPFLEDDDPPNDINDDNDELLHEDSGSQPFTVFVDNSQVRNRVIVLGSGALAVTSAAVGDQEVQVNDINAYSPNGGKVRITDPSTGSIFDVDYTGVGGVVGRTVIAFLDPLPYPIPQGSTIVNFFQADDIESQLFLAKVELDKDGKKTDGIHEYVISDGSLRAVFQLYMRAYAEIELFSKPIIQIRYATRDPKTRSGQTVHVDLTNPPCVGDFLIQDVTIDQIHDESDDLLPRYTASASSVRFELNDLLLKIIAGTLDINNSVSSAGIIATSTASADDRDESTALYLPNPAMGRRWGIQVQGRTGTAVTMGAYQTFNTTGPVAAQIDTYPGVGGISRVWQRFTPGAANANLCGFSCHDSADGFGLWEHRPKMVVLVRTAPALNGNAGAGRRVYWIGMSNTSPSPGSPILLGSHVMIFVDNPDDQRGYFSVSTCTNNGSQNTLKERFAPLNPSTAYRFTFEWESEILCKITVHDLTRNVKTVVSVPVELNSTKLTGSNLGMRGFCYGTNTSSQASVGYFDIGSFYVETD
jgi:hypothetical protein